MHQLLATCTPDAGEYEQTHQCWPLSPWLWLLFVHSPLGADSSSPIHLQHDLSLGLCKMTPVVHRPRLKLASNLSEPLKKQIASYYIRLLSPLKQPCAVKMFVPIFLGMTMWMMEPTVMVRLL